VGEAVVDGVFGAFGLNRGESGCSAGEEDGREDVETHFEGEGLCSTALKRSVKLRRTREVILRYKGHHDFMIIHSVRGNKCETVWILRSSPLGNRLWWAPSKTQSPTVMICILRRAYMTSKTNLFLNTKWDISAHLIAARAGRIA